MNDLGLDSFRASYVQTSIREGVAILTMNRPEKLNGWTMEMMDAFKDAFKKADDDVRVKAIVFTGRGDYYSAGVNLSSAIQLMHPKKLRDLIVEHNKSLFEAFLLCKKPLLIAINGHAIGASVTSVTLSNHVIAARKASFSTPFAALRIVPEGCSSIHFARLMGEQNAERMLGEEGWKPTAEEAKSAGLIQTLVDDEALEEEAFRIARGWVDNNQQREFMGGSTLEELLETNAKESAALADAFLSAGFLKHQGKFLWSKKKYGPSITFYSLWILRPLWSWMLR